MKLNRYPSIQQFTFSTKFVPLSRLEAIAIMNYQETRFNGRPKMYQKDVQILNELETRLDAVISKHFPKGILYVHSSTLRSNIYI